ncbi:hypothetical protein EBR03_06420, partial [bacterium]|nr:hypothetical protein [bacterium]
MSRQKAANIFEALNFIELEMKCFPSYAASLGRVSPEALKKFVVNVPTCEVPKNQDRIKLAEESWKRFLKGDQKITYLDLRYICWLPRISTTIELVKFVNKEKIVLRDRELRGLLFGGLTEYDRVKNDLVWRKEVRNIFDKSNERQRQLWNELELYCLRSEGLGVSILDMLKRRETPKDFIRRKFGLTVENGQFINLLSRELCTHGKELLLDPPREQRQWAYEKILKNAVQSDKLSAIESALTSMSDRTSVEAKQDLKKFLLDDPFLGDPRLKSGNWIAASDFLKKRIIEWFSSEDIRFFFESIFQAHLDTQGRKKFWMRYGSVVKRTRVLLNDSDRRQFQHLLV